jgi:carbon-monoxide dehydrogenase medium subunit
MWHDYFTVTSIREALNILAERGERARVVAGATDLILELERGVRKGIDTLIDITRIPCLDEIVLDENETIHVGPLVTHNHCVASKLIIERAFPLAQAAWEVGAPQIRNRGTVAGNLITASPANDTITPLMALGAEVRLASVRGERSVPLSEFYIGVRRTVLAPDEMLVDISFPAMRMNQRGMFIKLGLRRAQAISVVNTCVILTFSGQASTSKAPIIEKAVITLGAVAPKIIRVPEAEAVLEKQELTEAVIRQAAGLAMQAARPIDDIRGSAAYRREMIGVCISRSLHALKAGEESAGFPIEPVLLWGKRENGQESPIKTQEIHTPGGAPIITHINGQRYEFHSGHNTTLLRLLREQAGLIGTKEGCAEGECGACTVFLDGKAVMACLVPAARAHLAEITTIEGLAQDDQLHPVQQAFIEEGAVQCGYCTPGLIMSSTKLLEELPHPSQDQVKQAITGNLCRCTGYYKIVQSIEKASELKSLSG